jgi:hypothetical protein
MTPIERADEAKRVLDNPVMAQVFNDIRMGLVNRLESVPIGDIDTQHEIALTLQLLKKLKDQLQTYVNDVKVDQHREKQENFIQRMRQRIA